MTDHSVDKVKDKDSHKVRLRDKKEPGRKRGPSKCLLFSIFCTTMLLSVSVYFNYDLPQIYEDYIIHYFDVTPIQVEYLYSIYSLPNFIITPIGTLLLTTTGLGLGVVLFTSLVFFGAGTVFCGFFFKKFALVVLGRGIYGMGAEVALITQATISERWFEGKLLSVSISVNRSMAFLAVTLGVYLGPELFIDLRSIQVPLILYVTVGAVVVMVAALYFFIERSNDKRKAEEKRRALEESSEVRHFKPKDITKMNSLYWLVASTFAIGSQGYIQFLSFSTDFMQNRYGFEYVDAKNYVATSPIICMISLPILAVIIQRVGHKGFLLMFTMLFGAATYWFMRSLPYNPESWKVTLAVGMISFHYALFIIIMWPSMALSVPRAATAAGIGMGITLQNVFLTLLPAVFGYLNRDRTIANYDNSLMLLIVLCLIASVFAFAGIIVDFKTGKKLHLPENDKRVAKLRQKMQDEWDLQNRQSLKSAEYKSFGTKSILTKTDKSEKEQEDVMNEFIGR